MDTNKKLELVHSIRMENQSNKTLMQNREQIIYGTSKPLVGRGEIYGLEATALNGARVLPESESEAHPFRSFKIRFLIAVVIFCAFLFFDRNDQKIFEISMDQIVEEIKTENDTFYNFTSKLFDFL